MKAVRAAGFTLIELLTVIAIISILAGLTAVTLPGVLERAKLTDSDTDMRAIATSLSQYTLDYATYPPGYGYQLPRLRPSDPIQFNHTPYTIFLDLNDQIKLYDRFSTNYDTNRDRNLSRLEFLPVTMPPSEAPDPFFNLSTLVPPYAGGQVVGANPKRARTSRPYVYIPFGKKNIERMKRIISAEPDAQRREDLALGAIWDTAFIPDDGGLLIPPPEYDSFVLMSVGPLRDTRGILNPPGDEDAWLASTGEAPENYYYVLAMRAAYLATRDLNENNLLDFDYVTRTKQGEGKIFPTMPDGKQIYSAPSIFVPQ